VISEYIFMLLCIEWSSYRLFSGKEVHQTGPISGFSWEEV